VEARLPDETTTEAEATEPVDVDELRQGLLARLTAAIGEQSVLASHIAKGDIVVRVDRSAWRAAVAACKTALHCDYFCFLSGIDWMQSREAATRYEQIWDPEAEADAAGAPTEWETGYAGGDTRFQVFARVYSVRNHYGITLKADLDDERPSVESIVSLYRGADWHERETWEMFGFDFVGHPGLRHLYLPTEFEGFPLRKDFPLLARAVKPWPGLVDKEPIPGEGDEASEEASA
jgi:NADH-quinone oxidoreductase subunit C